MNLDLDFSSCVCRYTSPDMCFHLRCLVRCLRCPPPTLVLRCICPCSIPCQLVRWVRTFPWPTIPWGPSTRTDQRWWWKVALTPEPVSQPAAVFPSQWVMSSVYLLILLSSITKLVSALLQPPPPGHPPNAAQLAAMQGANVVMTQRKNNFFLGGSSGGYTIW